MTTTIESVSVNELQFNTDVIKECMSEMISVNKEELFNKLTYEKLKQYNESYAEKFDKMVDELCADISRGNYKQIGKSLRKLSKATESIYKTEILLWQSLYNK